MHHPQGRGRRQHHQKDEAKQHRPKRGRRRDAKEERGESITTQTQRREQHDPPRARRRNHNHQTGGGIAAPPKRKEEKAKAAPHERRMEKARLHQYGPPIRGEKRNTTPERGEKPPLYSTLFFCKTKKGFLEMPVFSLFSTFKMCEQYTDKYSTYRVAQHDDISSRELAWLKSWKAQDCTSLCP